MLFLLLDNKQSSGGRVAKARKIPPTYIYKSIGSSILIEACQTANPNTSGKQCAAFSSGGFMLVARL